MRACSCLPGLLHDEKRVPPLFWFRFLFNQQNFFRIIDFAQQDFNNFLSRGLYFAAYEAGFNGQFAMAAIDQHAELYLFRTSLPKSASMAARMVRPV